jgi:hypothetical protein
MGMKSKRMKKSAQPEQGVLLNVARTIGSTLGTLAAKTGSVSKQATRPRRTKKTSSKAGKTRNRRKA